MKPLPLSIRFSAVPQGKIAHDWGAIWMTPGLLACGGMVIFLFFFRNPEKRPE